MTSSFISETVQLSQAFCAEMTQPYSLGGRLRCFLCCTASVNLYVMLDMLKVNLFYPRPILAFGYCHCLRLGVYVYVCVFINHLLVRLITLDPFKLGSPNLDQRCETPWLRSLFFVVVVVFCFVFVCFFFRCVKPQPSKSKFTPFWVCPQHNSSSVQVRITKFEPDVQNTLVNIPVVLVAINLDLQDEIRIEKSNFLASPLLEIHNHHKTTREPWVVPRLHHRPDCFMVSILCTYL